MDLEALKRRLGEATLAQRLQRQVDHAALRFDRQRMTLNVHWENFDLMPKALELLLRATGSFGWASRNATRFKLRQHEFVIPKLPVAFEGYTILHLSDLHIDRMPDGGRALMELVEGLSFDLAVLTGDFRFDTYGPHEQAIERMSALVAALKPADGVLGVLGNHDYLEMLEGLELSGIQMLLNERQIIERGDQALAVMGVDDVHWYETADLERAVDGLPEEMVKLLLVHSPEMIESASEAGVDLYLCGHTHGGQVCLPGGFPLIRNARCSYQQVAGRWRAGNMLGYTSLGTGASGLPVRINCPPDVSLHRLTAGSSSQGGSHA